MIFFLYYIRLIFLPPMFCLGEPTSFSRRRNRFSNDASSSSFLPEGEDTEQVFVVSKLRQLMAVQGQFFISKTRCCLWYDSGFSPLFRSGSSVAICTLKNINNKQSANCTMSEKCGSMSPCVPPCTLCLLAYIPPCLPYSAVLPLPSVPAEFNVNKELLAGL